MDIIFDCDIFPKAGETIISNGIRSSAGGKGLNQAIAAARAGVECSIIGAIGDDDHGKSLITLLQENQVRVEHVKQIADASTGLAHIVVNAEAENIIIVASGANHAENLLADAAVLPDSRIYLAQLECPVEAISTFFKAGQTSGALSILNAAPAINGGSSVFPLCDIIILNEHELATFAGSAPETLDHDLNHEAIMCLGQSLISKPSQVIIVTLGARGVLIIHSDHSTFIAARKVNAVDTTGAGDCFCGALAARLAMGDSIENGVKFANLAASLAVGNVGAATAMPVKVAIEALVADSAAQ